MDVATPTHQILSMIQALGWTVSKVKLQGDQYVARASNSQTGQSIERYGKTEGMALAAIYQHAKRATDVRRWARTASWDENWYKYLEQIAEAYVDLDPFDKKATENWAKLAAESQVQAEAIAHQIEIELTPDPQPYKSGKEMREDVHNKQHLVVTTSELNHPVWTEQDVVNFRIAHDVLGICHGSGGWTWIGVNQAVMHHMPLLSPEAQEALFVEVVARTAYETVYKGHGPSKIGLLTDLFNLVKDKEGEHVYVPHGLTAPEHMESEHVQPRGDDKWEVTAMAADPAFLNEWIQKNGPYAYHGSGMRAWSSDFNTNEEMAQSIQQNGILPAGDNRHREGIPEAEEYDWSNGEMPSNYEGDVYEWWLEPRPGHTYMVLDPENAYGTHLWRIDLRKLDPAKINPDDDYLRDNGNALGPHITPGQGYGDTWDEVRDNMSTLGEQAEAMDWGSNPEDTHKSFGYGTIAYRGAIPPEAIELVATRKNYRDQWQWVKQAAVVPAQDEIHDSFGVIGDRSMYGDNAVNSIDDRGNITGTLLYREVGEVIWVDNVYTETQEAAFELLDWLRKTFPGRQIEGMFMNDRLRLVADRYNRSLGHTPWTQEQREAESPIPAHMIEQVRPVFDDMIERRKRSSARNLDELMEQHPDAGLFVSENNEGIRLKQIAVQPDMRGQGIASAALDDVLAYADQVGKPVVLTIGHDPEHRGLSRAQKEKWYRSRGFVPNKGRNKDWAFTEAWVRPATGKTATANYDAIRKPFHDLALAQRGEPEAAMLKVQEAYGGGVGSHAAEHIGDINHRMNEWGDPNYGGHPRDGFEYVAPKVVRMHRILTNPYGFKREVDENLANNAEYYGADEQDYRQRVQEAMSAYADAHAKLPVYNQAQWVARQAAIELGQGNYQRAAWWMEWLKDKLIDNDADYEKHVTDHRLDENGNLLSYPWPEERQAKLAAFTPDEQTVIDTLERPENEAAYRRVMQVVDGDHTPGYLGWDLYTTIKDTLGEQFPEGFNWVHVDYAKIGRMLAARMLDAQSYLFSPPPGDNMPEWMKGGFWQNYLRNTMPPEPHDPSSGWTKEDWDNWHSPIEYDFKDANGVEMKPGDRVHYTLIDDEMKDTTNFGGEIVEVHPEAGAFRVKWNIPHTGVDAQGVETFPAMESGNFTKVATPDGVAQEEVEYTRVPYLMYEDGRFIVGRPGQHHDEVAQEAGEGDDFYSLGQGNIILEWNAKTGELLDVEIHPAADMDDGDDDTYEIRTFPFPKDEIRAVVNRRSPGWLRGMQQSRQAAAIRYDHPTGEPAPEGATMYHVAPASEHESIMQHGLDWQRATSDWRAAYPRPERLRLYKSARRHSTPDTSRVVKETPPDATETLQQFWLAHPDLRQECVDKYGYDPIDQADDYWRFGLAEPEHRELLQAVKDNGGIFNLGIVKEWMKQELEVAASE